MKQSKILLLLFLCCLGFIKTKAQTEETSLSRNLFGLKAGFEQSYFKDINFSPLNYIAKGWAAELNYHRTTKNKNLFFTKLNFSLTTLKTEASLSFDSDKYLANIEIGFLKKIEINKQKWNFYFGGQYHSFLNTVFFEGTNAFTFFGVHGLDLAALLSYKINTKHNLKTSFSIPFFGYFVRPPYTGFDKITAESSEIKVLFTGKWTSINDFFGLNWKTIYEYQLSQKWNLSVQYDFRSYKTKKLDNTLIANNQITLGLQLKF